jgi:alpha-galactosidase
LLDEIRARHPQLCLENCASGGMRLDLQAFRHFDTHFLSDTVHPVDVLRIAQGLLLRFPPGRVGRWTVLRCLGSVIPQDDTPAGKAPPSVVVPGGATWRLAERTDLDFALAVGVPGVMGFSGDFLGCPPDMRQRVAWYVEFAKRWRPFIIASVAHLLTPVRPLQDRQGWIAWQLQDPNTAASLVFVYQLGDSTDTQWFPLFDLDPKTMYAVRRETPDDATAERRSGAELMRDGLCVKLSGGFHADHRAAIVSVQPDGRAA